MRQRETSPAVYSPASAGKTRREVVLWTTRMAGATAIAGLAGGRWVAFASAQDRTVTLTAAASEVSAAPGSAYARSAAAEAVASQGAARAAAAAALAESSSDGAIAQGAAAASAAEPDQGALARSANAVTSASNQSDGGLGDNGRPAAQYSSPAYALPRRGVRDSGGRSGRGVRATGAGGGGRTRRRDRVARLPATGTGLGRSTPLSSLLAAASAAAALGAVVLRRKAPISGDSSAALSAHQGKEA